MDRLLAIALGNDELLADVSVIDRILPIDASCPYRITAALDTRRAQASR
jgi:hypothetical protein